MLVFRNGCKSTLRTSIWEIIVHFVGKDVAYLQNMRALLASQRLWEAVRPFNLISMSFNETDYSGLKARVIRYKETLLNTAKYRLAWQNELREAIQQQLNSAVEAAEIPGKVELRSEIGNLEAIVLTLGVASSGLGEPMGDGLRRDLIKQNGTLVYQQLFNGKILVLIQYPYIEKYGEQLPPKTLAIYRPEEIKAPYILRHVEEFITEVARWEDYDDDSDTVQRIGFKANGGEEVLNTPQLEV